MAAITERLEAFKQKLNKTLNEKNKFTEILGQIEAKTGVNRLYIVSGAIVILALYLMIGYGAQFVCNFVGFIYPAYMSVKAVESASKDDDTQWLTYWVVYSCFHLIEFFSDIFLFWIPFYWFFKCCFLVWCFSDVSWNGSTTIYHKVIRPFILRHQDRIDAALDKAKDAAMDVYELVTGDTSHGNSNARELAQEVAADEVLKRATAGTLKED